MTSSILYLARVKAPIWQHKHKVSVSRIRMSQPHVDALSHEAVPSSAIFQTTALRARTKKANKTEPQAISSGFI